MAIGIRNVATGTNDGSSATVSATTDTSPVSGDLCVAIVHSNYYALSNMGAPSGGPSSWSEVTSAQGDGGTNFGHIRVYTGTLGSSGQFTVSSTFTGSTDNEKGIAVFVLTGADTSTPVDVAGGAASSTASVNNDAPSVDPTTTDAFLICATNSGGGAAAASYTTPSGMTERYDTGVGGISISGATLQLSTGDATGAKTFTPNTSIPWAATSVAIKTAAAGTTANAEVASGTGAAHNPSITLSETHPVLVADRGSTANTTSEASTAVDMAAAGSVTTGTDRYLIARVAANNSGSSGAACTLTVSDARNGSWTVLGPALQDPGAADAGIATYIAYVKVTSSYTNGDDVTFSWSPNCTAKSIVVEEWRRVHSTTPVAVTSTTANGSSGTPSIARTPTAASQTFYGALGVEGTTGDTYTEDADTTGLHPWTSLTKTGTSGTAASQTYVVGAYKGVGTTDAQTWNPTITSRDWAAIALVLGFADTGTTATAGNASGTGAAHNPQALVTTNAGNASATGVANNATALTGRVADAQVASGTGTANGVTGQVKASAQATTATGTTSAQATVQPNSGAATATGEALFSASGGSNSITLTAENPVSGTGQAHDPQAGVKVAAGLASATGVANDATVQTGASTTANAGVASATGAANNAATSVTPNAQAPSGTGVANSATTRVTSTIGTATGSGVANDAVVNTSGSTTAPAQAATGTGAAHDPQALVAASSSTAASTGTADTSNAKVTASAQVASSTGTAHNPGITVLSVITHAEGTGTAHGAITAVRVNPTVASGIGLALDATVNVSGSGTAFAGVAAGDGAALYASTLLTVPAAVATSTVTAHDLTSRVLVGAGVATATGTANNVTASLGVGAMTAATAPSPSMTAGTATGPAMTAGTATAPRMTGA